MKIEDALRIVKEAAERANARADPVMDSWLKKFADSPLTPLWMVIILVGLLVAWLVLT